jgi:hypothetical protein
VRLLPSRMCYVLMNSSRIQLVTTVLLSKLGIDHALEIASAYFSTQPQEIEQPVSLIFYFPVR